MLLLRRNSNASIEMHHEELYDRVNLFLMLGPSPSWFVRLQGTSVLKLVN